MRRMEQDQEEGTGRRSRRKEQEKEERAGAGGNNCQPNVASLLFLSTGHNSNWERPPCSTGEYSHCIYTVFTLYSEFILYLYCFPHCTPYSHCFWHCILYSHSGKSSHFLLYFISSTAPLQNSQSRMGAGKQL